MSLEFLADTNWINPQIDILLYLQNIRICIGNGLDEFFMSLTLFGEYLIPVLISAIIYWCVDIKKGVYLFAIIAFNISLIQFFKMIACVYRPWVLSAKIHPVEKAVPHAGGYSFPSGHSAMAASIWGGLAFLLKDKKIICLLLILIILCVGFSRMFLGVHTPQDVLVGFIVGVTLIFLTNPLINWLEENRKRYLYVLAVVDILLILMIGFIIFKHYPIDYFNHKILVEPRRAIYNCLINYGLAVGLINGCFLFRRFFDFNFEKVSLKVKFVRGIIGVIFTFLIFSYVVDRLFIIPQNEIIVFLKTFFAGFFVTFIYPLSFKFIK